MDIVLDKTFATIVREPRAGRPAICLTWAQSLDGKLASSPNVSTLISGTQSMQMTHALRALHDAILVGIGTVCADNPRLTCRIDDDTKCIVETIWKRYQREFPTSCDPVPVVLDSRLRTPPFTKFLHNPRKEIQQRPLIFCSNAIELHNEGTSLHPYADVIPVPEVTDASGTTRLSLHDVLKNLHEKGVKSLMVEGGAEVISSFLDQGLWDVAVITVAPTIFRSGVALPECKPDKQATITGLSNASWTQLGQDVVMIGFPT